MGWAADAEDRAQAVGRTAAFLPPCPCAHHRCHQPHHRFTRLLQAKLEALQRQAAASAHELAAVRAEGLDVLQGAERRVAEAELRAQVGPWAPEAASPSLHCWRLGQQVLGMQALRCMRVRVCIQLWYAKRR